MDGHYEHCGYTPPEILSWEIFINDNEKKGSVGLSLDQDAIVFKNDNFEDIFPQDKTNYGYSLNIAAGKNFLLLNYINFDIVKVFMYCGFDQHVDLEKRECIPNTYGYYTFPFAVNSP